MSGSVNWPAWLSLTLWHIPLLRLIAFLLFYSSMFFSQRTDVKNGAVREVFPHQKAVCNETLVTCQLHSLHTRTKICHPEARKTIWEGMRDVNFPSVLASPLANFSWTDTLWSLIWMMKGTHHIFNTCLKIGPITLRGLKKERRYFRPRTWYKICRTSLTCIFLRGCHSFPADRPNH